jgi:hypothetical protein
MLFYKSSYPLPFAGNAYLFWVKILFSESHLSALKKGAVSSRTASTKLFDFLSIFAGFLLLGAFSLEIPLIFSLLQID